MQALAASHPDIVPADVLALEAGRGLRAAECATLLDGWLRQVSAREILNTKPGDGLHPVPFLR